jgi:hypothetical protein
MAESVLAEFLRSVAADDPHRAVISARMHSLQRAWGFLSTSLSPAT